MSILLDAYRAWRILRAFEEADRRRAEQLRAENDFLDEQLDTPRVRQPIPDREPQRDEDWQ